jgi:hypothetical protein
MDLDGLVDLVTGNWGTSLVTILNGIGSGAFGTFSNFTAGLAPTRIAVGYVNVDSLPDVVAVGPSPGGAVLLIGQPGGFTSPVPITSGVDGRDVKLADVTLDGLTDVLLLETSSNPTASSVKVYTGDGLGGFPLSNSYAVGASANSLVIGHLDIDGFYDLVVTNTGANTSSILLSSAPGTFGAPQPLTTSASATRGLLQDFTLDGWPDLVALNGQGSDTFSLFRSNGAGGFWASTAVPGIGPGGALAFGDFDKDGDPDVAYNQGSTPNVVLGFGDGFGGFSTAPALSAIQTSRSLTTLDYDQDGALDLVVPAGPNGIVLFQGQGTGVFNLFTILTATGAAGDVMAADHDLDGKVDLLCSYATTTPSYGLNLFTNQGLGSFGGPVTLAIPFQPLYTVIVDGNLDGVPDVAWADTASKIRISTTTTPGVLAPSTVVATQSFVKALTTGDVNGDLRQDLVAAVATAQGSTAVLTHNGVNGFNAPVLYDANPNPTGIALGDLDQDGGLDVITSGGAAPIFPDAGTVTVSLNTGAGGFGAPLTFGAGSIPYRVAVSDVDGDGLADVGVTHDNPTANGLTILRNIHFPQAPVTHWGTGTSGCSGKLGLSINSVPQIGNPSFAFTSTNAPPNSLGLMLIGDVVNLGGSHILGVGALLHIDVLLSTQLLGFDVRSGSGGTAMMLPAPIPNLPGLVGAPFFGQAFFVESTSLGAACTPSPFLLVSSEALGITIQ